MTKRGPDWKKPLIIAVVIGVLATSIVVFLMMSGGKDEASGGGDVIDQGVDDPLFPPGVGKNPML
jgi:hypothetical protein